MPSLDYLLSRVAGQSPRRRERCQTFATICGDEAPAILTALIEWAIVGGDFDKLYTARWQDWCAVKMAVRQRTAPDILTRYKKDYVVEPRPGSRSARRTRSEVRPHGGQNNGGH